MPRSARLIWARELRRNLAAGARLVLGRPVAPRAFRVNPEQAILLVLVSAFLAALADLARAGWPSQFNHEAIPYLAFSILLGFAAWYLVARWHGRPRQALSMLVMASAASPVFSLAQIVLALAGILPFGSVGGVAIAAYWLLVGLYLLVIFRVVAHHLQRNWTMHAAGTAGYMLVTLLPMTLVPVQPFWLPVDDEEPEARVEVNAEQVFYAQHDLLERVKHGLRRERPGVTDVYFVGFGSYADEDVFMKEVHEVRDLFDRRFDTAGRSVALINNAKTATDTPIASATNLDRTLRYLGRIMNPDEDVLVLYLTSHGSRQHRLSVDFWPLALDTIAPQRLRQILDDSGIKWKVVMISACFSGGFIEALRDENTLIMTSASAGRESFGCGAESDFTYFGQALFGDALRRTFSFIEAFQVARQHIADREQQERFPPSQPQLSVSPVMERKLARLARDLGRRVPVTAALPVTATPSTRRPTGCGAREC